MDRTPLVSGAPPGFAVDISFPHMHKVRSKPTLFAQSPSFLANAYVGPSGLLTNYSAHASAWKEAADTIAKRALADVRGQLDYYFPVICYLYRHYVELDLKLLIRLAARIADRGSATPRRPHQQPQYRPSPPAADRTAGHRRPRERLRLRHRGPAARTGLAGP